jgi:DinB superfamily
MKSIALTFCMLIIMSFTVAQQLPQSNMDEKSMLTSEQRKFVTEYLQKTKQEFLQAIEGLTDEQLNYKSKEGKWCILDCAEHIALAEQRLFYVVQTQLKVDSIKPKRLKMTEKKIITRLTFRLIKVKAPEIIKPSGKFANIEAIKLAFMTQRDSTLTYIATTQDPLHTHYWKHPATGTIDLYQTLILMSAHTKRHIMQIEEVKNKSKFPKTSKSVKMESKLNP